jgi:hypothetical protein
VIILQSFYTLDLYHVLEVCWPTYLYLADILKLIYSLKHGPKSKPMVSLAEGCTSSKVQCGCYFFGAGAPILTRVKRPIVANSHIFHTYCHTQLFLTRGPHKKTGFFAHSSSLWLPQEHMWS